MLKKILYIYIICVVTMLWTCVAATPQNNNPASHADASFNVISIRAQVGGNDQSTIAIEFGNSPAIIQSTTRSTNNVADSKTASTIAGLIKKIDATKFIIQKTLKDGTRATLKQKGLFIWKQYVYITVADTIMKDDTIEVTLSSGAVESTAGKKNTASSKNTRAIGASPRLIGAIAVSQSTDVYLIYDGLVSAASRSEFTVLMGDAQNTVAAAEVVGDVTRQIQQAFTSSGYASDSIDTRSFAQYMVKLTLLKPINASIAVNATAGAVTSIDGTTQSEAILRSPVQSVQDVSPKLIRIEAKDSNDKGIVLVFNTALANIVSDRITVSVNGTTQVDSVASINANNTKEIYITLTSAMPTGASISVVIAEAAVQDAAGNGNKETTQTNTVQADEVGPVLTQVTATNSSQKRIVLYFDEDVHTIDTKKIVLTINEVAKTAFQVEKNANNPQEVYITLADMLSLNDTIVVTLQVGAVQDGGKNDSVEKVITTKVTDGMPPVVDDIPPTLAQFSINAGSNVLMLKFSETITPTSFDRNNYIIKTADTAASASTGVENPVTQVSRDATDTTKLIVMLTNDVAQNAYVSVVFKEGIVEDGGKNKNNAITTANNRVVQSTYVQGPTLTSASLMADTDTLHLIFSEPIKNPQANKITVKTGARSTTITTDNVVKTARVDDANDKRIILTLQNIVRISTYISIALEQGAVSDDNGNENAPKIYADRLVIQSTGNGDSTPPVFEKAFIIAGSRELYLFFSENIILRAFYSTDYTIRTASDEASLNSANVNIATATSYAVSSDLLDADKDKVGRVIKVTLTNAVPTQTYVSIVLAKGVVKDYSDNVSTKVEDSDKKHITSTDIADTVKPTLEKATWEAESRFLYLYFSEKIQPHKEFSSYLTKYIIKTSSASTLSNSVQNVAKQAYLASSIDLPLSDRSQAGKVVKLTLTNTAAVNTYVSIELKSGVVIDIKSNENDELLDADKKIIQVSDTKPPVYTKSILQGTKTLYVYFSESITLGEFSANNYAIYTASVLTDFGSSAARRNAVLSASIATASELPSSDSGENGKVIKLHLQDDVVKNSYLAIGITAGIVKDLSNNNNVAIKTADPRIIKTQDTQAPSFVQAKVYPGERIIYAYYSEPVIVDVDKSKYTVKTATSEAGLSTGITNAVTQIELAEEKELPAADKNKVGTVVKIIVLNKLPRDTHIALTYQQATVKDSSGNSISAGSKTFRVIDDVKPTMLGLKMKGSSTTKILFFFSEPITVNTEATKYTIQEAKSGTTYSIKSINASTGDDLKGDDTDYMGRSITLVVDKALPENTDMSIQLAEGVVTDGGGNANVAISQVHDIRDTIRPTLERVIFQSPRTMFLYYSEKIHQNHNKHLYKVNLANNATDAVTGKKEVIKAANPASVIDLPNENPANLSKIVTLKLTNIMSENIYMALTLDEGAVYDMWGNNIAAIESSKAFVVQAVYSIKSSTELLLADHSDMLKPRLGSQDMFRIVMNQELDVSEMQQRIRFFKVVGSSRRRQDYVSSSDDTQAAWWISPVSDKDSDATFYWEDEEYVIRLDDGLGDNKEVVFKPRAGDITTGIWDFNITDKDGNVLGDSLLVDYESGNIKPPIRGVYPRPIPPHQKSMTISNRGVARSGKYAIRTQIGSSEDYGAGMHHETVRRAESAAENKKWAFQAGRTARYTMSVMIPLGWEHESNGDIIFQAKRGSDAPDVVMLVHDKNIVLRSFKLSDSSDHIIPNFPKDTWIDLVLDIKWEVANENGFINVFWKKAKDAQFTTHKKYSGKSIRPQKSNGTDTGKAKWGNYRPGGGYSIASVPHVYYHDDIRIINFSSHTHSGRLLEVSANAATGDVIAIAQSSSVTGYTPFKPSSYTFSLLNDVSMGGLKIESTSGKVKIADMQKIKTSPLYPRLHFDVRITGNNGAQFTKTVGYTVK